MEGSGEEKRLHSGPDQVVSSPHLRCLWKTLLASFIQYSLSPAFLNNKPALPQFGYAAKY